MRRRARFKQLVLKGLHYNFIYHIDHLDKIVWRVVYRTLSMICREGVSEQIIDVNHVTNRGTNHTPALTDIDQTM